jgi:HK97 gp10 family phage protein|tara:strand:+ start:659 stop:1114 length:456 start_codon:yes stop_codon:yes gene_type:complete
MTQIKATVVGSLNVEANISKFTKESKQLLKQAVFKGVADVEKDAKISIQRGGKSGFVYQRYNPRRTHQSSAPGEAPASDTGFLVNSIKRKMDGDGFGGEIASRAFYSKFLEFGTVKMLPRPFMFPALEKNRKKITQRLKQVIKSATMKPRK